MSEYKVLQCNMRESCYNDGSNHWRHRKAGVCGFFRKSGAAFICMQECRPDQEEDMRKGLRGSPYQFYSPNFKQQANRLMFDSSRFRPCGHHSIRLPGQGKLKLRYHHLEIFDFERRRNGERLRVITTHFLYNSAPKRNASGTVLANFMRGCRDKTVIACGDFNTNKGSEAYKRVMSGGSLRDAVRDAKHKVLSGSTWCGWRKPGRLGTSSGGHMDWVLYHNGGSLKLRPRAAKTIHHQYRPNKFLSDHWFVEVTFARSEGAKPEASKRPAGGEPGLGAGRPAKRRRL